MIRWGSIISSPVDDSSGLVGYFVDLDLVHMSSISSTSTSTAPQGRAARRSVFRGKDEAP